VPFTLKTNQGIASTTINLVTLTLWNCGSPRIWVHWYANCQN